MTDTPLTRRRMLTILGAAAGAGAAGAVLAGCSDTDTDTDTAGSPSTSSEPSTDADAADATTTTAAGSSGSGASGGAVPSAATALTAADFAALATCTLLPEKTAGPFPLDEQFDRRDVTEGTPGHPMRLGLRVVDDACAPVPRAAVEIWHCDATGDYSAFTDGGGGKDEGAGTTFLRGTQTAGDDGIVEFLTIVPGWYSGRAVHVHLRVHLDDNTVLTSQLFFDEDFLSDVYQAEPYAEFGEPDTSLAADGIAGDAAGEGTILVTRAAETSAGTGTLALLNLGIDPDATSTGGSGMGGPGGPPPGGRP